MENAHHLNLQGNIFLNYDGLYKQLKNSYLAKC